MTVVAHRPKLAEIQILRGLAAAAVVLHHYALAVQEYGRSASWIVRSGAGTLGACGVDLFFVISGFIMVYVAPRTAGVDAAREFMKRRLQRVVPPYWLWTTVVLVLWASGLALKSHEFKWPFLLGSYLLVPVFNGHNFHPLLDPGWTLSFEMLFYAVFAISIWVGGARHRLTVMLAGFVVTAVGAQIALPAGSGLRGLMTSPLILEFLYGVCVAHVVGRLNLGRRRPQIGGFLLLLGAALLLSAASIGTASPLRAVVWGGPSALIVAGGALLGSAKRSQILILLGDASYSLYLSHGLAVLAFAALLKHSARLQAMPGDLWIVSGTLLTLPLGIAAYFWLERPLAAAVAQGFVRYSQRAPSADA